MIHFSVRKSDTYETIDSIARKIDVPKPYLNKIISELSKLGYLKTKKGPTGGVKLLKSPENISVKSLLEDIRAFKVPTRDEVCCVPAYLNGCITKRWSHNFKETVIGKVSLQDLTNSLEIT